MIMAPRLQAHMVQNFRTLMRACRQGDVALVSAIRVSDGQPVSLVCAMQINADESITPVPFAEMIDGNPYELYEDPTVLRSYGDN